MAINVIDFGAQNDGTGDSIVAFNAAHNALPANGGTIIIPIGQYHLSATWTITKPVILVGESAPNPRANEQGSWLYFDQGITGISLPSSLGSDASNSQISNLYVSSKSEGGIRSHVGDGIVIGVHGVIIRDCAFANFGRYGILVGDGTSTNNANGTLIEATSCAFNGSDGFHLYATNGGCGVSTFINIDCSGNKGWGFWHEGGAKNTFLTAHANSNSLGAFYEAGNSTAWINCYGESESTSQYKENEKVVQTQFFLPDGRGVGLFCLAGDYGSPLFTGGTEPLTLDPTGNIIIPPGSNVLKDAAGNIIIPPGGSNALNSPGNIIIAPARGYPTRWALSGALTIGRDGSTGALEIVGGSTAGGSLSDWFLNGSGVPDKAIQIFNQHSFRADLYITGGDANNPASDRVGIGYTSPQAKLHVRPHVSGLDALRVDDSGGNVLLKLGVKPIVTGSRGGNAALGSLVSALSALGLITDNTTT